MKTQNTDFPVTKLPIYLYIGIGYKDICHIFTIALMRIRPIIIPISCKPLLAKTSHDYISPKPNHHFSHLWQTLVSRTLAYAGPASQFQGSQLKFKLQLLATRIVCTGHSHVPGFNMSNVGLCILNHISLKRTASYFITNNSANLHK